MNHDTLDDDHPLWLVNEQIKGLLEGDGATEEHESVLTFLRSTGLPEGTVRRMHRALVHGDTKVVPPKSGAPIPLPEPPAFYRYQFESYYGPVWRSSDREWNGQRPCAHEGLYSAEQMHAYARDCVIEATTECSLRWQAKLDADVAAARVRCYALGAKQAMARCAAFAQAQADDCRPGSEVQQRLASLAACLRPGAKLTEDQRP